MATRVVTCPGSGQATQIVYSTSNPKVHCPHCHKKIGVHHGGKLRKHTALRKLTK